MAAVAGFHNAGVAGLAAFVKAPVVEGADHLAGVDVLVQAAVFLGAGIGGLFRGQGSKAFLGCLALLPLAQQILGGLPGGSLLLVGVGGIALLVGGAALKAGQNVADIDQGEPVVGGAPEIHNVVAGDGGFFVAGLVGGGGGAGQHHLVAFLTAAVADPLGDNGVHGIVPGVLHGGAGGIGVGIDGQSRDGGVQIGHAPDVFTDQAVGVLLGGGSLFFVGGGVVQIPGGAQVVLVEGVGIVVGGIQGILGVDLIGGEGQAVLVGLLIGLGGHIVPQVVLVALHGGTLAVHGLQVILGLGVAVEARVDADVILGSGDLVLILLGQGVALGSGFPAHGVDGSGALGGGVHKVIGPGFAGFLVVDLLVQGLTGVQAEQRQVGGVLGVEAVDGVDKVVAQLLIAHGFVAHHHGNGFPLPGAGVGHGAVDAYNGGSDDEDHQNHGKADGIQPGLPILFVLRNLLFGQLCGVFFSTKLLLAGCTHLVSFPLVYCVQIYAAFRVAGKRAVYLQIDPPIITEKHRLFKGEKPEK